MFRRWLLLIPLIAFILSCAATVKTPIHKIVGSDTIRAKVVLKENPNIDFAYQKLAVREVEAKLLNKPVTVVIRSRLSGGEVDFVLITRKEVQKVYSTAPEDIVSVARASDTNVVIVVEPLKVKYDELVLEKDVEVCVIRSAKTLLSAKVFDGKRGDILMAGVYEGKEKAQQCAKGIKRTDKLPSKDGIVLKAFKRSAEKFAKEFWKSL